MARSKTDFMIVDHISPLNMNSLQGRIMRLPAQKATVAKSSQLEILIVAAPQAALECYEGLARCLRVYDNVTVADLPGFGGMSGFAAIGQRPSLDAYAQYVAALLRLTAKRRPVVIFCIAHGLPVVTHMLQRHPSLARQVRQVVAVDGYSRFDDFIAPSAAGRLRTLGYRLLAYGLPRRLLCTAVEGFPKAGLYLPPYLVLDSLAERGAASKQSLQQLRLNGLKPYFWLLRQRRKLDVCGKPLDVPMLSLVSGRAEYLDAETAKQHILVAYRQAGFATLKTKPGQPLLVEGDNSKAWQSALPPVLRKRLAELKRVVQ